MALSRTTCSGCPDAAPSAAAIASPAASGALPAKADSDGGAWASIASKRSCTGAYHANSLDGDGALNRGSRKRVRKNRSMPLYSQTDAPVARY